MKILLTTDEVIDALGGNRPTAEVVGVGPSAVSNWRKHNLFPAKTYLTIKQALRVDGYDAPDALWRWREAAP